MPSITTATATLTTPAGRRSLRRRRPSCLVPVLAMLVAAVVLAACTGDADDEGGAQSSASGADHGDAQAYIDVGVASLMRDEEFPLDQETATCISTATVDLIGADALARAGVSPREFAEADTYEVLAVDMPEDGVARLSESFDRCDVAGAFTSIFAAELGVELPADAITCLDDHVDREAVHDAVAGGFLAPSGGAPQAYALESSLETALIDAVIACPSVMTAMFLAGAPGTVTPETEACVSAVAEANPDRVRAALSGDSTAAEDLGTEIGSTCAGTLG